MEGRKRRENMESNAHAGAEIEWRGGERRDGTRSALSAAAGGGESQRERE
jgi:hypothetical protein